MPLEAHRRRTSPSAHRQTARDQPALPALAELHSWLLANQCTVAAGSGTAKAIGHALKRWPALQRYATSGSLRIDNSPVNRPGLAALRLISARRIAARDTRPSAG
ncbi:MAG: transposase [Pseudomonadota bacterium]|nr:transposase [Pseudomonadota bacterium]